MNEQWFMSLQNARVKIKARRRRHDKVSGSHSELDLQTPEEYTHQKKHKPCL